MSTHKKDNRFFLKDKKENIPGTIGNKKKKKKKKKKQNKI